VNTVLEHDYEVAPGLPQDLPRDERVLWRGASDARSLALGTFHVRKLAVYFAALLGLRLGLQLVDGAALATALPAAAALAALAAVALGLLSLYASMLARSTIFTITNRRIVIRCGVAVPLTVNIPFSRIDAVNVRERHDGSGEIALVPEHGSRVSYVLLWPMVKPWRLIRVQPVLRGLPEVAAIAAVLADAIAADAGQTVTAREPRRRVETPTNRPDRTGWRDWLAYPRLPLAAATSLAVVALASVALLRVTGAGPEPVAVSAVESVAMEIALEFHDRDDGSVVVMDAADGAVIDVLEPGTNGFVRGMLRSLARARRAVDAGPEAPFYLQRMQSGRLLLSDAVTGQEIDLRAFGPSSVEAFERFLPTAAQHAAGAAKSDRTTNSSAGLAAVASKQ
jgi:putative photosynthetic complex assembly protein